MKLLTVRIISRRLALPAGLLVIGVVINSQLLIRAQAQDDAAGFQVHDLFPRSNPQPQNTPPDARRADTQAGGNISGAVLDQSGAVSVGAKIRLSRKGQVLRPDVVSGNNGQFSFSHVPPGPFQLTISAPGFANQVFSGELRSGQFYLVPVIVLPVATAETEVRVGVSTVEVA
ncbi:MAG TPA: carboxypeptidase-like regulatory domain-containing protein, partial [Candidatus Bathyarchaeia archaeon]|nr:carboxypeptidase-like regulatory domain-containing protein [Candidatus Bathyarchaeia archaeon]